MALTYNTTKVAATYIYRATGGGVTFSANLAGKVFDYFTDTAVVNDALYIGRSAKYWSDVDFNIGTAMAGTGITLVWEYYRVNTWVAMTNFQDDTANFTATGAKSFKFGYPFDWRTVTVGGTAGAFIRCRIAAKTTVTEGGANATTQPTIGDGAVNIDGFTTGSPCTLTMIYNYMNTNYPYVGVTLNNKYFDFKTIAIITNSPTVSSREILEIGPDTLGGSTFGGYTTFDYWTTGTAVGTENGRDGSTIFINATTNSGAFAFTIRQRSYGARYLSLPAGKAGYPSMAGEFYDCLFEVAPGGLSPSTIIKNCTYNLSFAFIASTWNALSTFSKNRIICSAASVWAVYTASFTIYNPDIVFTPGRKNIFSSSQNNGPGLSWNIVDPVSKLPSLTDNNNIMSCARGTDSTPTAIKIYTAATDTYVDNTTFTDVPIYGEVGDCIYIKGLNALTDFFHFSLYMNNPDNDYEYEYEYYKGSAFKSFSSQWDETLGLKQTGCVWFERAMSDITATTIDGLNTWWYRIRITKKGTGTPKIDTFKRRVRGGTSTWNINEQYTVNYSAVDSTGNPLEGVNIIFTDSKGTIQYSGTTDALGIATSNTVMTRKWYFDPLDPNRDVVNDVAETRYNPFDTRGRKYGYKQVNLSTTINAVQNPVDVFIPDEYIVADQATAAAYTGIAIDGLANTITITGDHTMQELYDYGCNWAVSNMAEDKPYTTTDGQTYVSDFDLILDGCKLTGNGTIDISNNSLTMTGTSTLDVIASNGVYTNIHLNNVISGSTIVIKNITDNLEIYSGIVLMTSLICPVVWTADKSILIKVMFVGGVWFEARGTLTNSGLILDINQDGVLKPIISYASIC